MKLHFAGRFNGNESLLPQREHPEYSVRFKELSQNKFFLTASFFSIVVTTLLIVIFVKLSTPYSSSPDYFPKTIKGIVLAILSTIPHQILHALFFKEDVYLYLKRTTLFLVGTEDMSKKRFIFMCLFPNIIFGFIPFVVFLFFNNLCGLGIFSVVAISTGTGDFINAFNVATQMPKGAKTYLSGFHSYWYIKN